MKKRILIILSILIALYFGGNFLTRMTAGLSTVEEEEFKIAACPTYHYLEEKMPDNFKILKTGSTSQSFSLLNQEKVDFVFSGRTLAPQEPDYDYEVIGEGYSFISRRGGEILEKDLKKYTIYTDLNSTEIKEKFSVGEIFEVENVYDFLEEGIGVTSWDNTDYFRMGLIHLLKEDGNRNPLSRRLTVYCSEDCDERIVSEIKNLY